MDIRSFEPVRTSFRPEKYFAHPENARDEAPQTKQHAKSLYNPVPNAKLWQVPWFM